MRSFLLPVILMFVIHPTARAEDASTAFQKRVLPVLTSHCIDCHSGQQAKAKLDLAGSRSLEQLRTQSQLWFHLLERVEAGTMPPQDSTPLQPAEKQALAAWVRGEFTTLLLEQQQREGRSKFRRLSRNEYANTVQDIFGIRPPVRKLLPGDGRVDGYDRISTALPFSTAVTEGQLAIAELIVEKMFEVPAGKATMRLWANDTGQSKGHALELPDGWWVSFNSDTTSGRLDKEAPDGRRIYFPGPRKSGLHRLRMHIYGYQTDKPLPVGIYVGHVWAYPQILELLKVVDAPPGKPAIVEADVYLRMGWNSDGPSDDGIRLIPLGLGVPVPKNTQASVLGKDRPGLAIQWVDVVELEETLPGQRLVTAEMPAAIQQAFNQNATLKNAQNLSREELQSFVTKSFAAIGARLYRRDLNEQELSAGVARYMEAVDGGMPLRQAFVTEVAAMMTAPDFLCLVEHAGRLSDFALASRLSYFLCVADKGTQPNYGLATFMSPAAGRNAALYLSDREAGILSTDGSNYKVLKSTPLDTTDRFHWYRLVHTGGASGSLFLEVDGNEVLRLPYSELLTRDHTALNILFGPNASNQEGRMHVAKFGYRIGSAEPLFGPVREQNQ